jgi:hypothetical protein
MTTPDARREAEIRSWIADSAGPYIISRSLDDREEDVRTAMRLLDAERAVIAELMTIAVPQAKIEAFQKGWLLAKKRADAAEDALTAERAKSEGLRAALYEYGCHRAGCGFVLHRTECTCGLRAARSASPRWTGTHVVMPTNRGP